MKEKMLFKYMKKINHHGFTLIELLVVIAIVGILSAIAVTSYVGSTLKAQRTEAYSNLESLRLLEEQFFAENASYTNNFGTLSAFQAGPAPYYNYALTVNVALPAAVPVPYNGATVAQNNCFIATATGLAGTRVANDVFAIDCNNNRNF